MSEIVSTPGICSGAPRIEGTRIRVQDVAAALRSGWTVETIVYEYDITTTQFVVAVEYYEAHRAEIDAALDADGGEAT